MSDRIPLKHPHGHVVSMRDERVKTPRGDCYYARHPDGHVVELPLSMPLKPGFELTDAPPELEHDAVTSGDKFIDERGLPDDDES